MLFTVSARRSQALETPADLGFLLHKHPDRVQQFAVYGGTAHVYYPEISAERCTAALLVEVDPFALVRARSGRRDDFALGHYVNDRPYAASSLLSVAMGKVFRSAMAGRCEGHQDLADSELDLTVEVPAVPGDPDLVRRLFAPMGWRVHTETIPLDPTRPDWGEAPLVTLQVEGTMRLRDALTHFYVLLPVLDRSKHYWVGEDEVDKLLRAGAEWLPAHPERELIAHLYLAGQRGLRTAALDRLAELDGQPADEQAWREAESDEREAPGRAEAGQRPLVRERHDAVLGVVSRLAPTTVADLGCGSGALLASLLEIHGIEKVIGTDVSDAALTAAAKRLHVATMTERQAARLELWLSSLLYDDERLAGADVAVLMEVVEHVDLDRLPTVERNVFASMRPRNVVVTTPNREYNARYPALAHGGVRHDDHRFEWSRAEFEEWARRVAHTHGYEVRISAIGEVDPEVGSPTQMAVFDLSDTPEVTT